MERLKDFKDFLVLPNLCPLTCGVDLTADKNSFRFKISILLIVTGFLNITYMAFFQIKYFLKHYAEFANLLEATKTVAYFTYIINTNIKFFAVFSYRKTLRYVVNTTEEIYPKSVSEKLACQVNQNFWPLSIYLLVGLYFVAGFINYSIPGFQLLYELYIGVDKLSYQTPFWVEHPFDYHSIFPYCVVYFAEIWCAQASVGANLGIDLLLCCLCRQISMHFKYIGRQIERHCPTGKADDSAFLSKLIEKHQLILKLCSHLNEIFGISLVFSLLTFSGLICLSAFQVTTEGMGLELFKFLTILTCAFGQLFITCFFGDELTECSISLGDSVFNHPWHKGSESYKKMLIILILRSQKPANLIAKGFCTVSLVTFNEVTRLSYKFLALLNTFQNGD